MSNKGFSEYAREFNESCLGWSNERGRNITVLRQLELYFNYVFMTKGELYLNDVYREIGIPEEPKYKNVGWNGKTDLSDGFISFRLFEMDNIRETVYGEGPNIMLDFNVDGVIRY